MRIVAGRHKGRALAVPAGDAVRPTSDRAREAIFNIIAHGGFGAGGTSIIPGARVLDAFCGTGAMGLEALSRGAAHAVFVDTAAAALAALRANIAALGVAAQARVLAADATEPRPRPADLAPVTLAFFDPPYALALGAASPAAFAAQGWLAPGAICTLEQAARGPATPVPAGFALLDERRYGAARVLVLRYAAGGGDA